MTFQTPLYVNGLSSNDYVQYVNNNTTTAKPATQQAVVPDTPPDTFVSSTKSEVKLEKNKGFLNKVKHLFTGKDYYKTSTGVKVSTDKNTGAVYEASDGSVYIDGVQNAKIKGTRNNDDIYINSSSVEYIKGKSGDDSIIIENSTVNKVNGNGGQDSIAIMNSYANNVNGGTGADDIYTHNSNVKKINGSWGKDNIETNGGHVETVKSTIRDNVEIHNNPLNPNPDSEYAF